MQINTNFTYLSLVNIFIHGFEGTIYWVYNVQTLFSVYS